jgi:hypothetical protein
MKPGRWMWMVVSLVCLLPGIARAEGWRPELSGALGGTFGVRGTPNEGGPSGSLSVLWPVADRFSFGVMLHADDAGSRVDSLRDAQGHGLTYGKIEQVHRLAVGASWRLDALLPGWRKLTPAASATWGYYRIRDDVRGAKLNEAGSLGCSLGAIARWPFGRHLAMGASVRYHRLFNDLEKGFMNVSLEGAWR